MKITVTTTVTITRADKTTTTRSSTVHRTVGDNPARERGEVRVAVRDAAVVFSQANDLDENDHRPL